MPTDLRVEPMDAYNKMLLDNVHPADWKNPTPAERYNLVVIGGGTAGLVTAAGAAGLGAKVALVERAFLGGDCLNYGCVPSKALLRSAATAAAVTEAARFGVRASGPDVDFSAVMARVRKLRSRISAHDSAARFAELGVDVFLGEGRFAGKDTVEVEGTTLRFARAVIATGGRPVVPKIEGLDENDLLTNESVFSLTELPRRLAVLGGGPIGCELSQAFARLGSEVTIIDRGPQLLHREDAAAAEIIAERFKQEGINHIPNATIARATTQGGEKVLHISQDAGEKTLTVDALLVGAGRRPNVEGLQLGRANVGCDARRGIVVDDYLRTTNPRIYAAGDVCMKYKFTHAADAAARIVIQNALFFGRKRLSALTVPWCTYTDPAVAHVGISESEAAEQSIEIDTFTRHFSEVDRAITDGHEEGLVKIHVAKGTDKILGATIVAPHAGDMIGEIVLAMRAKVGLGTLASVIHPYPTLGEAIRQAGDAYNRTRLTPFVKKMFTRLLAWRR